VQAHRGIGAARHPPVNPFPHPLRARAGADGQAAVRRLLRPALTLSLTLYAREGADGQAAVRRLLRGSSQRDGVAPNQPRGALTTLLTLYARPRGGLARQRSAGCYGVAPNAMGSRQTSLGGAQPLTTIAYVSELQRDWARPTADEVAKLFAEHGGGFGQGLRWEWQLLALKEGTR
jgi:hypothetical protein